MANVADFFIDTQARRRHPHLGSSRRLAQRLHRCAAARRRRRRDPLDAHAARGGRGLRGGRGCRADGELAVVAGSCGPGNLHFINGLFDANRNRVPVLAIASHIPSAEIGSTYFQETHPQELFRECSVYTELVGDPRSCRGCSRSRCAPRSRSAVSRSSSCPATCSSPTPRPPPTAPIGRPVGRAALRRASPAADCSTTRRR
jgi:hypothetical protein